MAQLTKMIIFVALVQFILVASGLADIPGSTLYDFITNPIQWDLNALLSLLTSLPALAGVTGIVYGTLFRNDLVTFAGLTLVLISFGQSLAELFNIVRASLGNEIAVIIISPIIVTYVFAVIAFWRGQKS